MFRFWSALFSTALVLLAGCASVSVDHVSKTPAKTAAPARIYVQDFVTPAAVFRVDRDGEALDEFRAQFSRDMALATAERLNKRLGIPAWALGGSVAPRGHAWMVVGRFVRVNQGSRALRTVVGLGLGGTKIETEVMVYDLAPKTPRLLLRFITTGGTNAQPGVAAGLVLPNFWLIGLDTLAHIGPGLSHDAIRTSRQIVAVLSEYMAREGLLPPEKVYRAKKLGKWP